MAADRYLIVNADDFGQSPGVNRGIMAAHERGIVTSTSLMVRWPAAAQAAEYACAHPRLSVGLHVDLGEWALLTTLPLAQQEGRVGEWVPVYEVVGVDNHSAVAEEVSRQLVAFRLLMGRNPTHLDSHQHVHLREPARSVLVSLATELAIPLRHCSPEAKYCGRFYGQDIDGSALPDVLSIKGLSEILTALPPRLNELACHPGDGEDLETMYRKERAEEVKVLCDPRLPAILDQLGIELRSFHNVQEESR